MNRRAVRELRDARRRTGRRATALATACVVLVALVLYGAPVPRLSEELYLPLTRHVGDPSFLAGDWTMHGAFGEHWVFTHVFGPIAAVVPLTVFGWVGRLVAWTVLAWLLVRLGDRIGLPPMARGGRDRPLADREPGAHRRRLDVRHLRGQDRRRHPRDRGHPRRHPRAGRARDRAARARGHRASRARRLGRVRRAGPRSWRTRPPATAPCAGRRSACCSRCPVSWRCCRRWGPPDTLDRFLVIVALPYHLDPFYGGTELAGPQVILRARRPSPRCWR